MRLLTVTHFFETHGGGVERVAGQLCRQFVQLGETVAWAASDADRSPDQMIEAVPLPCINPTERQSGLPMPIPGIRGIRALSREVQRSDVVIIHDALYVTSVVAMLTAKAWKKPTVLIQHIAGIPFSSRLLRSLMRAANLLVTRPMLWAADRRVFISDTVRQALVGKRSRLTSELLFNGVDQSTFAPGERRTPDMLAHFVPDNTTRCLLFVGRYVEKKGLAVLREMAQLRPDLMFVLAGAGPIKPQEWALANIHDVGPQKQQALADLYRWADALILPSVGEGFPLVIQEAMACGLPVICGAPAERADPAAAKWLRGVSIDLSDPTASARRCLDAVDRLAPSTTEREEMARYALATYDWREMAQRLLALAKAR